ncbi:uncharacterized protein Pyn_37183 [Prunus yedoensis var. nudiflora]|uniref:Uncharacterized protein n=1 Tax=Prunus yedoensis var. nudiflora TaxID=2094558 RepID=A0A314UGE0_PRUYE|nr:uncharacterized protein Pyn_37183 [Prunus yedoensis var. nudiflora]
MKAYKPMVHPMPSQDLWPKTNFPPSLPPKFHKQPGRPKKTKISSAGEPSPSSNPKAKHLPRYNLEIKCSICKQPGYNKRKCPMVNEAGSNSQVYSNHVILKVLYVWHSDMDFPVMFVCQVPSQRQKKIAHQGKTSSQRVTRQQSRQKQASSSTQSRQKQSYQKLKKRINHDQAEKPSHQPPQPSHQPAQPSQSNQAQQPSHQPAQPSQASQFKQPSQASQFEQPSEVDLFEQASQSEQPNSSRPLQASPQRKVRLKSPAKRKTFLAKFKPWRY